MIRSELYIETAKALKEAADVLFPDDKGMRWQFIDRQFKECLTLSYQFDNTVQQMIETVKPAGMTS